MGGFTAASSLDVSKGRRSVLAICGGGNGGHALAVVASQNFDGDIDWLVGSEEKADLLRRGMSADGLHSTGVIRGNAHRLRTISADPAQVIPNADIVMIVVPAFVHAMVLRRIAPHVSQATTVGCLPTRGGFEFEATRLIPRYGGTCQRIFGLQTLPWSTRVVTPGRVVNIGAAKAEVVLAALPAGDGAGIAARLSEIIGTQVVPAEGFLNLTLGNPGQFIHPGLMYGHFRSWRGEEYEQDGIPMFYADATDEIGEVVEGLSDDAIEVRSGNAVNLQEVIPVHEWLRSSYGHVTGDTNTVATCLRTGPIRARKAPMNEVRPGRFAPNFGYRYLSEDVPYGLVITRALADIANVRTPTIDEVVRWAQSAMQKIYLVGEELEGRDVRDLPIPQHYGVSALSDLIEWYRNETSEASHPRALSRPL
jgi:NAD/NADP octopine/nopaline dehydrogenase, alpha-helical domain